MKIVVVTGGFDPIHSGHLAYFKEAKKLGDWLIVGVNSDAWLARKKGRAFMPQIERYQIIDALDMVNQTVAIMDDDDNSCCNFLRETKELFPDHKIIFANGGDRTHKNIPEMSVEGIEFEFGVGGTDKANSSSWILEEWKAPKTLRPWGYYRVLHEVAGTKVKELTVEPGQSLSMQRHKERAEYWMVTDGQCRVEKESDTVILQRHSTIEIPLGYWHRLSNPFTEPCKLVEVQYGISCVEEDIERR
jgi:cytidyltransferase-like protein